MKNLTDFRKTGETGVDPRLCSAGNIDMLSTEVSYLQRGKVYCNTQWIMKYPHLRGPSNGCPY